MKNFPKTLYVTAVVNSDAEMTGEFYIDLNKAIVASREEIDTEVAVYQLVKVGVVSKISKIVFDE